MLSNYGPNRHMSTMMTVLLLICAAGKSVSSHAAVALPIYSIELARVAGVEMSFPGNLPFISKQCGTDGSPYIWAVGEVGMQVVRLGDDAVTIFSTNKITDVSGPIADNFAVSDSTLSILVTEHPFSNQRSSQPTRNNSSSEEEHHRQYIARFRDDGTYLGAVRLEVPLRVGQLGQFGSGDYLIAGLDDHKRQRLAIVDSGGQFLRFVDLPVTTHNPKHGNAPKSPKGMTMTPEVLGLLVQLYSFQGNVMFTVGGQNDIYMVRSGGDARVVHVHGPTGSAIDHIIPADANWFIDITEDGFWGSKHGLYEVNPQTGELVARYRPKVQADAAAGHSVSSVEYPALQLSCSSGQEFTAVAHDDDKLVLLKGVAQQH